MTVSLKTLRTKSMALYLEYQLGFLTQEEYQQRIKPLDDEIDELELQALNNHLQDTLASEISSLQHLH